MATKRQRDDLLHCLLGHLDQGVAVGSDIRYFAESMYGWSPDDLRSALADPDDADCEAVLLLIFTPGKALRHEVERLLCRACFTEQDAAALAEGLLACRETVPLFFENTKQSVTVPIDEQMVRALIDKLDIHRQLDSEVCSVLKETVADEQMIAALVAMRRKKIVVSDQSRSFLCFFIRQTAHLPGEFGPLFDLVLTLLDETKPGQPVENYLFEKRANLIKTVEKIEAFARSKEQYGLEYLLMHRYQVPPESAELVRRRLAVLDRLIFDILHLVPPADQQLRRDDLGTFTVDADLERLLRTLS